MTRIQCFPQKPNDHRKRLGQYHRCQRCRIDQSPVHITAAARGHGDVWPCRLIFLPLSFGLIFIITVFYELPIRRFLNRCLRRREPLPRSTRLPTTAAERTVFSHCHRFSHLDHCGRGVHASIHRTIFRTSARSAEAYFPGLFLSASSPRRSPSSSWNEYAVKKTLCRFFFRRAVFMRHAASCRFEFGPAWQPFSPLPI